MVRKELVHVKSVAISFQRQMLLMSFRYRVQSKLLDVATVEYHKCSKPNQIVFDFALG